MGRIAIGYFTRWVLGLVAVGPILGCVGSGHLTDIIPAGLYRQSVETDLTFPDINTVPSERRLLPEAKATAHGMSNNDVNITPKKENPFVEAVRLRATELQDLSLPQRRITDEPDWSIEK